MAKWIQLDLFTGKPIKSRDEKAEKLHQITKTTRLALEVQLSIARLDPLTDTVKLIGELCQQITGIAYPFDIAERRQTQLHPRQQESNRQPTSSESKTKSKEQITKEQRLARNAEVRKRVDAGEKQTDVAKDMGLSDAAVSQIMKNTLKKTDPRGTHK